MTFIASKPIQHFTLPTTTLPSTTLRSPKSQSRHLHVFPHSRQRKSTATKLTHARHEHHAASLTTPQIWCCTQCERYASEHVKPRLTGLAVVRSASAFRTAAWYALYGSFWNRQYYGGLSDWNALCSWEESCWGSNASVEYGG